MDYAFAHDSDHCTSEERNSIDTASVGRPINPLHDGLTRGLCDRRPDTGGPCPLLWYGKNNTLCDSRHANGHCPPIAKIVKAIMTGTIQYTALSESGEDGRFVTGPLQRIECQTPGCKNAVTRGKHCRECVMRVRYWESKWHTLHPDQECPDEWRYRWTQPEHKNYIDSTRRSNARASRNGSRRAKTFMGGKCATCGGRERYESGSQCVVCSLRRSKEQRLRRIERTTLKRSRSFVGVALQVGQ